METYKVGEFLYCKRTLIYESSAGYKFMPFKENKIYKIIEVDNTTVTISCDDIKFSYLKFKVFSFECADKYFDSKRWLRKTKLEQLKNKSQYE